MRNTKRHRGRSRVRTGWARVVLALPAPLALFLAGACSGESGDPVEAKEAPAERAVQAADSTADGTLLHLEARFVAEGMHGEVTFKVVRENGETVKELEIEIEGAEPGQAHPVSVGGFEIGELRTDLDGEGDLKLSADARRAFPAGFSEPEVGTAVRIGELAELRFERLEKLARLESRIQSSGVSGKVKFKLERLGEAVTREFALEIDRGPPETEHEVRLDGTVVGTLELDEDGEGELEYSEIAGDRFPDGFPDLRGGSRIEIGELFAGELEDKLAEG